MGQRSIMAKFSKKSLFIGSGLGLAGILATSLAFAAFKHGHHHNGHHGDGYEGHKGGKHSQMIRLHKLDQDNDDALSLTEFQAPAMKSFEALDSNQDGMISSDEYLARTTARFAKFDADHSGIIEESEFPKRHKGHKDRKGYKENSNS